jgi:predicted nucleic acid-binding protein
LDWPTNIYIHRQTTKEQLTAPRLFRSEITAVVRKAVYQQRITPEQGRLMLSYLLVYPVKFYEDTDLLKEAIALNSNRLPDAITLGEEALAVLPTEQRWQTRRAYAHTGISARSPACLDREYTLITG